MSDAPRLLLVNDNPDARRLLLRALTRGGFERITEAADGREAVEALTTGFFDLIVTDVHMPHLDGWRLSRMVRSGVFQSRADVPIVVVSATFGERIAHATAREYGVNRFLALDEARNLDEVVRTLLRERGVELSKPRLLVIEDRPDTQRLVDRILNKRFEVEIRGDGPSGLDAWRLGRHDLVLLDVMLPKMSGYQVLREILRERPTQAVVMMTAFGSMERSQELMLEGAADFIAKPFEAEQLRRVCEIAVRREDYMVSNEQFAERLRALQESEEAHRKVARAHQNLLDHLGTVVFELDGDGQLRFLNAAWRGLSGYSVEESLGRRLEEWLADDRRDALRGALHRLEREPVNVQLELPLVTAGGDEGEERWCEFSMDAVELDNGARGVSGRIVDVSERRRTQLALRRAKEGAESASRAKSAFLATMSHEIRTPMNAILGMAELLGDTGLDDEQREFLRILRNAGGNLLDLLDDLLDVSRVESGRLVLAHDPFDVAALVREAVEVLTPDAQSKGLALRVDVDAGFSPWRLGDHKRLRQVLLNLVGNAIKFTASGWVSVHLSPGEGAEELRFEVEDTGIGLPDHLGERIFDSFTQGDSSITREYGGSGLGLSICKRLVELMEGAIRAEDGGEGGARFIVTLPLRSAEEGESAAAASAPFPAASTGEGLDLLVVEDADDNRLLIKSYLKKTPNRLVFAENGEQAVEMFKARRYDLVLMDMQMPVMDGCSATRLIRQWEREQGREVTPVVALTAHAFKEDVQRSLDAGCDDHLSKPIKKTTLLEVLARYGGRFAN